MPHGASAKRRGRTIREKPAAAYGLEAVAKLATVLQVEPAELLRLPPR
jgi:hypothetical protein